MATAGEPNNAPYIVEPCCTYCGGIDGWKGRHLVPEPAGYREPLHRECIADLARWGSE